MDIQELIKKYEGDCISKQELGTLRRALLTNILESIKNSENNSEIEVWLDKNRSKLCTRKLAQAVGYDCKPVNIRQSFKTLVTEYEKELRKIGSIEFEAKSNIKKHDDETVKFLAFIQERLDNPDYQWPKNIRGGLYRKAIWAFYLDVPLDEIDYVSSLLTRNKKVKDQLADIDVLIANDKVKTLDFASKSAIDEMSETYLSQALSSTRKKLKDKTEEVVFLRHEVSKLEQRITKYENRTEALQQGNIDAFKKGSIH